MSGAPKLMNRVSGVMDSAPGLSSGGAMRHAAWQAFVKFCVELQHGEIERLRIQDGLPLLAEVTRKKIKFAP